MDWRLVIAWGLGLVATTSRETKEKGEFGLAKIMNNFAPQPAPCTLFAPSTPCQ